jgi:flotillin
LAARQKKIEITAAETAAEQSLVKEIKVAEAAKQASESLGQQVRIQADAHRDKAEKEAEATNMLAEAMTVEHAAKGLAEPRVMRAQAVATQERGMAEAKVLREKYQAEAQGISEKGKRHERARFRR